MFRQPATPRDANRKEAISQDPIGVARAGKAQEEKDTGGSTPNSLLSIPAISLPKGGGSIRGMGEKFSVNPVTGTAGIAIPLPLPPGRSGFGPELSLAYDSGAGNGPFGLGWHLSLPAITRKTEKGLPTYEDTVDSDTYVLAGAEDLVPAGEGQPRTLDGDQYTVRRYRPRIEGAFTRIERWMHTQSGDIHWRIISRDNQTSIFGRSTACRIYDPAAETRVFSWLLEESYDNLGNIIRYVYRRENWEGVNRTAPHEQHRLSLPHLPAQRYLTQVLYGNDRPGERANWHFQVVFDYGDHAPGNPLPDDEGIAWPVRRDPFSTCRAGFEIRTYRLCRRVLVYHQFAELGEQPALVRSLRFDYDDRNPAFTYLAAVVSSGHREGVTSSLPPLEFSYTAAAIDSAVYTLVAESLANLPIGIDGSTYQWIDLDGEGAAGVLTLQADAWWYARNGGEGRLGPLELVATQPAAADLGGGRQQLTDLGGDGRLCLVQYTDPLPGFYERTPDANWKPFQPFVARPNVAWEDPTLRFVDVTGDGLADVLIDADTQFVVFPSLARAGFGSPIVLPKPGDEEQDPALVFADAEQTIFLADMNGDGLSDIVRIRNGEVCYWPSLGYGRFAPRVTMADAPWFDYPDFFQARHIRLVDVDGSGTTDILYLGQDGVTWWPNAAGNRWGTPQALDQLPLVDSVANVQVLDLLGTGTACLVWSSPLPGNIGRQIQYVDLLGSRKPHLLGTITNNLGAQTELRYAPATRFYLQDRAAGEPWATRLPFPVQVVEQTIARDLVTGSTFTARSRYRHGYYDIAEREFRGFGLVEQWDTASYADSELDQPPVHTKTWFHTGAYEDGPLLEERFAEEYYDPANTALPPTVLPPGLTAQEAREAARALKGLPLRSEIYAEDSSPAAAHPYSVETHAYTLKLLQAQGSRKHAVFFPHPREAITYHYERNPADPRVAHAFTLAVDDEWGIITRSAAVVYGRRNPAARAEQRRVHVTCSEIDLTDAIDSDDAYHAPLPWQTTSYEVTGMSVAGSRVSWETIEQGTRDAGAIGYEEAPSAGRQKRLIERERQRFYRDDLAGIAAAPAERLEAYALPFGRSEGRPLPYEGYKQAFTPGLLRRLYETRVDDDLLRAGGYVLLDGAWWIPTGRQIPDPDRFYLAVAGVDPFGNRSTVVYDRYGLNATQVTDPLGSTTQAAYDYRTLQPSLVTDANGNQSAAAFDTLGMVAATALLGKAGDLSGDDLAGLAVDLAAADLDRFLADPRAESAGLLARATSRIVYDVGRWQRLGQPVVAATISREQHVRDLPPGAATPVQIAVAYSDGLGRSLQAKAQAEPGAAPARGPDGRLLAGRTVRVEQRWIGSGRTVYNNKGNRIKQYEPFFSDTAAYEAEAELVETGVTPILHYDPLGRVTWTELPDGTLTRVVFNPWEQETWDQNDTVVESPWYRELGSPDPAGAEPADPQVRAAWLAAQHAGTPARAYLDSLGRTFATVADNGPEGQYETRLVLDIEGNQREVIDARPVTVMWQDFDMLGRALHTTSADAGERRAFTDVAGQPLRRWDSRGHTVRTEYDALRRPTHIYVAKVPAAPPDDDSYAERLVERIVYGDAAGTGWILAQSQAANLRGQVYRHYDGAGVATSETYDFQGNLLRSTRQLARAYRQQVDWSALGGLTDIARLQDAARPALEDEIFRAGTTYDALGRPTSQITPNTDTIVRNEIRPTYNAAGLLERVDVRLRDADTWTPFVTNIDYDAKGQRTLIVYGNGVGTLYTYDPLTFRLTMLRTWRPARPDPVPRRLQDLRYTYDPVGNITAIRDNAQQTVFFANSRVEPTTSYAYDAIYRLVRAEGREHASQNNVQRDENDFEPLTGIPHPNDPEAMQRYVEEYVYDAVGNILQMRHSGGDSVRWTRAYTYAADSNHLLRTSRPPGRDPGTYRYDAHGSMIQMPHLVEMAWDYRDQLRMSRRQAADPAAAERTWYVYDASGERVRKATDRANGSRRNERIYWGGFEIYRDYGGAVAAVTLERDTLHVMDGQRWIALVETKIIDAAAPIGAPQPLTRYQLDNHLGSTCLEVDERSDVISYEEYHPYGTTAYYATHARVEASPKRHRYTGKERDEETGLNYHSARYYASWMGRWTSPDPAGILDGTNRYQYSHSSPVLLVDTTGRQSINHDHRQQHTVSPLQFVDWLGSSLRVATAPTARPAITPPHDVVPPLSVLMNENDPRPPGPYRDRYVYPTNMSAPSSFALTTRSFAPFETFGGGYHGDNRGFSAARYASARARQVTTFTLDGSQVSNTASSDVTHGYGIVPHLMAIFTGVRAHYHWGTQEGSWSWNTGLVASAIARPSNQASVVRSGAIVRIQQEYGAAMPLNRLSPDIDVQNSANISLQTEADGRRVLHVSGVLTGDCFPNAEVLLSDRFEQTVLLHTFATRGGWAGPFRYLWGDSRQSMGSYNVSIQLDHNGRFTAIGNRSERLVPIGEWNRRMQGTFVPQHTQGIFER